MVSRTGTPTTTAFRVGTSSITRSISSAETNGRAPSWITTMSQSEETFFSPRLTDCCRLDPPVCRIHDCLRACGSLPSKDRQRSKSRFGNHNDQVVDSFGAKKLVQCPKQKSSAANRKIYFAYAGSYPASFSCRNYNCCRIHHGPAKNKRAERLTLGSFVLHHQTLGLNE